ncbi:EAL domain-containing protein [Candidatus Gracilibacteria bacterium]|nr:EAL domain-containing protein [Candidatus Gracilibacteria bacterium]
MNKNIGEKFSIEQRNNPDFNNSIDSFTTENKSKALVIINENFGQKIDEIKKEFFLGVDIKEKYKSNFQNLDFLENLNSYIGNSFGKIAENNNLNSYNEIYFFLYFFSIKEKLDIYDSGDIYDEKKLFSLLNNYFDKIVNSSDLNNRESILNLNSYLKLCGLCNIICLLNQNNSLKKDFIYLIIDFITVKINSILPLLEEKLDDKNIINGFKYILGLFELNYSYITYVNIDKKDQLDIFLEEEKNILLNTIAGYNNCKSSDFGGNLEKKQIIDRVFIINITYIISLLDLKLIKINLTKQDYENNTKFIEIINLFKNELINLGLNINLDKNLADICNFIFIKNYKGFNKLNILTTFEKKIDINDFLSQFSFLNFTNKVDDLELIHHILLFNTNINNENIYNILYILVNQNASTNLNYEVIRLRILNIILTRLAPLKDEKLKYLLNKTLNYVDKNKVFSHLLYTYSLMYASLSYCYSFFDDEESQNKTLTTFAKFKQINNGDFIFDKYGINTKLFFSNMGFKKSLKYGIIDKVCYENRHNSKKSCPKCADFNFENIVKIGRGYLEEYAILYRNIKTSKIINDLDSFLINNKDSSGSIDTLKIHLEKIFKTLFHGIVSIDLFDDSLSKNNKILDKYNDYKDIDLINGYILRLIYPISFKTDFDGLYYNYSEKSILEFSDNINKENGSIINEILIRLKNFLESFNEKNKITLSLVSNFEKALEDDNISLMFQGIHNSYGDISKYEVLSRINISQNDLSKYNIRDYIDAIIKLKRGDLLKKLIKNNIKQSIDIINKYSHINLSINIEYNDIINEDLIYYLEDLAKNNINIENITFELIEGKWDDNNIVIKNLKRLKHSGYKIAMDDFGSGESSINRLLKLFEEGIVDYVKIDGEIIKRLSFEENNNNKQSLLSIFKKDNKKSDGDIIAIIKMIVAICKNHNVKIIAEFVENKFLFDYLSKLGVDLFQGYYLSKPLPENEILK